MITSSNIKEIVGRNMRTLREYSSFLLWATQTIPKITEEWTDFLITDPGIIYTNGIAYLFDHMNYRLDREFIGNRLRWSTNIEQLYFMAQFMGLEVQGYESAKGKMSITNNTSTTLGTDVAFFPKGSQFYFTDSSTNEQFLVYLDEDINVPEGQTVTNIPCTQGELHYLDLEETDFTINEVLLSPDFISEKLYDFYIDHKDLYEDVDNTPVSFDIKDTSNIAINTISITPMENLLSIGDATIASLGDIMHRVDDAILTLESGISYSVHYTPKGPKIKISPGAFNLMNDKRFRLSFAFSKGKTANGFNLNLNFLSKDYSSYKIVNMTTNDGDIINSKFSVLIPELSKGISAFTPVELRNFIGKTVYTVDTLYLERDYNTFIKNDEELSKKVARITKAHDNDHKYGCVLYFIPQNDNLDKLEIANQLFELFNARKLGFKRIRVAPAEPLVYEFKIVVSLIKNIESTEEIVTTINNLLTEEFDRNNQFPPYTLDRDSICKRIEELFEEIDFVRFASPITNIDVAHNQFIYFKSCEVTFEWDTNY